MNFDEALSRFETQLRADRRSPHTVSSYLRDLGVLRRWLEEQKHSLDIGAVTPDLLGRFITAPAATQKADGETKLPASIDKIKMSIKAFFTFLVRADLLSANPARLLQAHRTRRALPEILTEEEAHRLLKVASERRGDRAQRDAMILDLFLHTGIRLHSLVGLDVGDARRDDKHLLVRRLKGGGETKKFLPSAVRKHLEEYLRYREAIAADCSALFLSSQNRRISTRHVERIVSRWLAAAGIKKEITPHGLRHTFASHLYAKTKDILVVKRALDHNHVSSSEVYTQVSDHAFEAALEVA